MTAHLEEAKIVTYLPEDITTALAFTVERGSF
jgi:hypothetical protein